LENALTIFVASDKYFQMCASLRDKCLRETRKTFIYKKFITVTVPGKINIKTKKKEKGTRNIHMFA